jgi:hypothetical protein
VRSGVRGGPPGRAWCWPPPDDRTDDLEPSEGADDAADDNAPATEPTEEPHDPTESRD